ncbi:MAG: hypothetical protein LKF53_02145 [Solobacterium sp.]|jgi:hypothetical protein|nr:hypothetical protein [Solobacterium sp.]MCH4226772.1 hypothetical protein [Solobacterium sp.]MCH4281899.1 hypothetical protein [Solobacterium sp.]
MNTEITIDTLEEFRGLSSEYQAIQQEIESLYNPYCSPSFDSIGCHSENPVSPTERSAMLIIAKKADLETRQQNLGDKLIIIEDWLDTIPDSKSDIRSIIRWHYLLNMNWIDTCLKVYGFRSKDTCRNKISRYFGVKK